MIDDLDAKIKDLYVNKKVSATLIAQALGCATGTVIRRLRCLGVEINPRGGANHTVRYLEKLYQENPVKVKKVLANLETNLKEKAAELEVAPSTLRAYLRAIQKEEGNNGKDDKGREEL